MVHTPNRLRLACVGGAALAALLAFAASPDPAGDRFNVDPERVRVIDGDTFVFDAEPVRLWGIDAPEKDEWGGQRAMGTLSLLIDGSGGLTCDRLGRDHYGRTIARCTYGPDRIADLACALVARGAAKDWPLFSDGAYAGCSGV